MANLYLEEGDSDRAEVYSRNADNIDKNWPETLENASTQTILARLAYKRQRFEEAANLSRVAAMIVDNNPRSEYRLTVATLDVLIQSLRSLREDLEATRWEKRRSEIRGELEKSGCEILAVREAQN
jgi:hypothetical protein